MSINDEYELLTPEQQAWFDQQVSKITPDIIKLKEESSWQLNKARV